MLLKCRFSRRCLLQPGWGVHSSRKKALELMGKLCWGVRGGGLGEKSGRKPALPTTGFPRGAPGNLKYKCEDTPPFAGLKSWEARLLSGALEIRKHWTFWPTPLALELQGFCQGSHPLLSLLCRGGKKEARVSRCLTAESPSSWPWLKVIFLLRIKTPFVVLLRLSETIWAGFASLVFRCKSKRAYLSSPQLTLTTLLEERKEDFRLVWEVVWWTVLVISRAALTGWKEAVNCFYPHIPLYVVRLCLKIWVPGHGTNEPRRVNVYQVLPLCQALF